MILSRTIPRLRALTRQQRALSAAPQPVYEPHVARTRVVGSVKNGSERSIVVRAVYSRLDCACVHERLYKKVNQGNVALADRK